MKNLRVKEIIITLLVLSFLIACGGGKKKSGGASVGITITPTSTSVVAGTAQTFTVAVTGSNNTGYTIEAPAAAGCPTAAQSSNTFNCTPTTATAAGSPYTITVKASADTSKTASATLTVTTPVPVVVITITPVSGTNGSLVLGNVELGNAQAFTVSVTGSSNTGYTVSAPAAAGCPTAAPTDNTFTCTPTAVGTYTITVRANADTTKTQAATLNAMTSFGPAPVTASTVCSNPIGTGTNRARIIVASNFYKPAQTMVNEFQASSYGTNTSIVVCHNSTGTIRTEITGGNVAEYKMFFAADESAGNQAIVDVSNGATAFTYASGVPILAAKKDVISNVGGLITGLSSSNGTGDKATITDAPAALAAKYQINTASAQKVSVADPGQAPYGVAAQLILNSMMGANIPTNSPEWVFKDGNVAANGLWNNIDNTFAAINTNSVAGKDTTGVKSGIIGKSQICSEIAPNAANPTWVYVEFTHPDFIRNQKAIVIDSTNSVASSLNNYIKNAMTSGAWTGFLSGNCYNPVP